MFQAFSNMCHVLPNLTRMLHVHPCTWNKDSVTIFPSQHITLTFTVHAIAALLTLENLAAGAADRTLPLQGHATRVFSPTHPKLDKKG